MVKAVSQLTTPTFPLADVSTVSPVIGNPEIYKELTQAIKARGNRPDAIIFRTSFQEFRWPITSYLFKDKDLKLNADKHSDFLLIRSMDVLQGKVSFLEWIPGTEESDKTGAPTEAMIRDGVLLSAAYFTGNALPIGNLELTDTDKDGVQELHFTELGEAKTFDGTHPSQTFTQEKLLNALFAAQTFLMNHVGYLDIPMAVADVGNKAQEAQKKSIALFYDQLSFAFLTLKKGPDAIADLQKPDYVAKLKAVVTLADRALALPKADQDKIAERTALADKSMKDALEKFRWQEGEWANKKMERSEFYSTLEKTADPAKRRNLVEAYTGTVVQAHRKGLFTILDDLNAIARQHGYQNYPDYYDRVNFGMSPQNFADLVEGLRNKVGDQIAALIEKLKAINGGQTVYEWDVDYLIEKFVKQKTGGELPKLTFDEAYAIARRWFKDIGWDPDKPPFKNHVFLDIKKRANKEGNAYATGMDDGSRAWFSANFDPKEKITLEDLDTIIHELTHDGQFIFGAQQAKGSIVMGAGGWPNTWLEGSAFSMGDIVYNKDWMDRYLADLPEFKDSKVRETAAEVLNGKTLYKNMMVLCRALFENNLYQDKEANGQPIPLETRLHNWQVFAKKYMHVETMDATQGGYIYATPHFANNPGYYVAYGGGRPLGVDAMEFVYEGLAKHDDRLLRLGGQVFRKVLEQGARNIDAPDLVKAIAQAKQQK